MKSEKELGHLLRKIGFVSDNYTLKSLKARFWRMRISDFESEPDEKEKCTL